MDKIDEFLGRVMRGEDTTLDDIENLECNGDPNKVQVDWTKVKTTENKERFRVLIDSKELQQKVLDYISSEDIDKMIRSTIFDGKPECKSAIIHGMCIASMLASYCEPFCIIEKGK